jgi:hypothetical protein
MIFFIIIEFFKKPKGTRCVPNAVIYFSLSDICVIIATSIIENLIKNSILVGYFHSY